jgi:hypothetical protein
MIGVCIGNNSWVPLGHPWLAVAVRRRFRLVTHISQVPHQPLKTSKTRHGDDAHLLALAVSAQERWN